MFGAVQHLRPWATGCDDLGMICLNCTHYLPSKDAGQRAWMEGYGYCNAGRNRTERSMFFNAGGRCWLRPVRFNKRFVAPVVSNDAQTAAPGTGDAP